MKITILCSDPKHPIIDHLMQWAEEMTNNGHDLSLINDKVGLTGGDILFLVSCSQLIRNEEKSIYRATLVLHASDLPKGRGWSPYIWAVLSGETEITVSLLEASEPVDSGAIWAKTSFQLAGHELLDEIHEKLFEAELFLMRQAVESFDEIVPNHQVGDPGAYYVRRSPNDSKLDINKTIAEQFNLLRVVDSQRFPAFFEYLGHKYLIKIEKDKNYE